MLLNRGVVTQHQLPLFHPQKHGWLDHFAWNEDAPQIVGLTPTGRAPTAPLKMNRQQWVRVRQMWVAMNEHPPEIE